MKQSYKDAEESVVESSERFVAPKSMEQILSIAKSFQKLDGKLDGVLDLVRDQAKAKVCLTISLDSLEKCVFVLTKDFYCRNLKCNNFTGWKVRIMRFEEVEFSKKKVVARLHETVDRLYDSDDKKYYEAMDIDDVFFSYEEAEKECSKRNNALDLEKGDENTAPVNKHDLELIKASLNEYSQLIQERLQDEGLSYDEEVGYLEYKKLEARQKDINTILEKYC
jgi:hypothetical protein